MRKGNRGKGLKGDGGRVKERERDIKISRHGGMRRKRRRKIMYLPEFMRSVTQSGVAPSPSS